MSIAATLSSCVDSLCSRLLTSLPVPKAKYDKLGKQLRDDSNKIIIEEFIREPECSTMYVYLEGGDKLMCSTQASMKKKGVFVLKSREVNDCLKPEELRTRLTVCECTDNILSHLHMLSHEIFFPLLQNPANRSGWSAPTAKEVMLQMGSFLSNMTITVGQSKGQTLLPHPPAEAFDAQQSLEKERVQLLETSVNQWTNKIQSLLAMSPESQLKILEAQAISADKANRAQNSFSSGALPLHKHGEKEKEESKTQDTNAAEVKAGSSGPSVVVPGEKGDNQKEAPQYFPGPYFELDYWQNASTDLASLSDQLSHPKIQQVQSILANAKSPCAEQILSLQSLVRVAQANAEENSRYLRPLKQFFVTFTEDLDFTNLEKTFQPLFHTLLLIFKHSKTYNTRDRLICLLKQLCNAMIASACKHVNGETIFRLIEDESANEAVLLLKQTIKTCSLFKSTFYSYAEKAKTFLGNNTW